MSNTVVCLKGFAKNPRVTYTESGKVVFNVKVSSTLGYGDRKTYVNYAVSIWNECKFLHENLNDGDVVSFSGSLNGVDTYTNDEGKVYVTLKVTVGVFDFCLHKPKDDAGESDVPYPKSKGKYTYKVSDVNDFQIPF